jgi:antitoxin HicB
METTRTFRILLRKEPEGVYTAMVPSLPGCVTWGDTVEKALEMIEEAIIGYIQVLKEEGEPIPDDNGTLEYSLQLSA